MNAAGISVPAAANLIQEWLVKSRPQLTKLKKSLVSKLPFGKELYDKVDRVLAIDPSQKLSPDIAQLVQNLRSDIKSFILERKQGPTGLTKELTSQQASSSTARPRETNREEISSKIEKLKRNVDALKSHSRLNGGCDPSKPKLSPSPK